MRSGLGVFRMVDGTAFKGQFQNDMRHGRGCLFEKDRKLIGTWLKDHLNGLVKVKQANGSIKLTIYKDDMIISKAKNTMPDDFKMCVACSIFG